MDSQNMAYTADNGGGYDQSYDPNVDSNVPGSENYPLEDQNQYDSGYAQPPLPATHSATAGSLFRSEEMALCQLFLQVCSNQILLTIIRPNKTILAPKLLIDIPQLIFCSLKPLMLVYLSLVS